MTKPLDTCPTCGERDLIAVCNVVAEYAIANEGGGQSWDRRDVDDETSEPTSFRCGSCGSEFSDFELDDDGYLTSLRQGEVLIVVHISSGLLVDVGCRRRDIARLRVVVVDDDLAEEDPDRAYWTETPTAVEDWPVGATDPLSIARGELPDDLVTGLRPTGRSAAPVQEPLRPRPAFGSRDPRTIPVRGE
jgi:hypothetical protein